MTNDKVKRGNENYRRLKYFYDSKIKVYFKDFNNIWYNGIIEDLDINILSMVLKEDIRGIMPFLLEDLIPESIVKSRKEKK